MIFTNNRETFRQAFFIAWEKYQKKLPTEPIEAQLIEIILIHPEYHCFFEQSANQQQEFQIEENPFLHMALHLAIREQIRVNRPAGINQLQHKLLLQYHNQHEVEHRMMECLAKFMWQAQQKGETPDEAEYLVALQQL